MSAVGHYFQRPISNRLLALYGVLGAAIGITFAMAPLPWAAAGIVGILAGIIILIRPRVGFYLLIASLPILLPWSLPKLIVGFISGATLIWVLATHRPLLLKRDTLFFFVIAFIGTVWWSGVTAHTNHDLLANILKYTGFPALYWTIVTMASDQQTFRRAIMAAVLSGVVGAAYGLYQLKSPLLWVVSQYKVFEQSSAFIKDTPLTFQGWQGQFRIESFTGTPDVLAYFMMVLCPFVFYWAIRTRNRMCRYGGLILLLIFLSTSVLTLSRGAFVAIAVMVLAVAVRFPLRRVVPAFALAGLLLVVAGVIYPPVGSRMISVINRPDEKNVIGMYESATWRLESYKVGVSMLVDHLAWGAGAGQQEYLWEEYSPELVPSSLSWMMPLHNTYLLTGVELGGLGLLALLALLFATFRELFNAERKFRAVGNKEWLYTTFAIEASLCGLLVAGLFSPLLRDFHYFWALIGFTGALKQISLAQPYLAELNHGG